MTDTTIKHPFEKAGLGVAPFRCTGVRENWYSPVPEHRQPGGTCSYCGTGILYEYSIVSSDGRTFVVGSDCVARTGAQVEGFKTERLKLARAKRDTKRAATRAAREAQWKAAADVKLVAFTAREPDLTAALLAETEDSFLMDLARKLKGWGDLSDRQVEVAKAALARRAQKEADKVTSRHVGTVGARIDIEATILATRVHEYTGWPRRTAYWTLLRDTNGNVLSMFGTHIGYKGDTIKGRFTVKAHEEYQGTLQTKLARPHGVVTVQEAA